MSILIKGLYQLQDGLYAVHDGIIHKYKAKGGTARSYKIESIDLVRCRECVHSNKPWNGVCEHPAAEIGDTLAVEANDYCSFGEREK